MKLDAWVRQTRTGRGWGYEVHIFKDEGNETYVAQPMAFEWVRHASNLIPTVPTLYLTQQEFDDLRRSLTDPMRMQGIRIADITTETALNETREHLKTVKAYADRMLSIIEKAYHHE